MSTAKKIVMKFIDFSKFRNNELNNYFLRRELNNYLEKQKKDVSLRNPMIGAIFSGILTALLWSARDSKEGFENILKQYDLEGYYYLVFIALVFSAFLLFFFSFKIFMSIASFFKSLIIKYFNTYILIGVKVFKRTRENFEKEKLELFKYEVANQISLALSMVTHIEIDSEEKLENENKFYAIEAYIHLMSSMTMLNFDILRTPFRNRIKDPKYIHLNYNRIQDLLDLSKDVKKRIEKYWGDIHIKNKYNDEITQLSSLVNRIQKELNSNGQNQELPIQEELS